MGHISGLESSPKYFAVGARVRQRRSHTCNRQAETSMVWQANSQSVYPTGHQHLPFTRTAVIEPCL
jgi:hypothetical protein